MKTKKVEIRINNSDCVEMEILKDLLGHEQKVANGEEQCL